MSRSDSDVAAKGWGCLILIAVIWFVCSRIAAWISRNKETVDNGIEIAKKIGMWTLVGVVLVFVLKKVFAYRKRIRHSEVNYLSVVLNNHDFDGLMRRTKMLSENAQSVLSEVGRSQEQLERGLKDLRNEGR